MNNPEVVTGGTRYAIPKIDRYVIDSIKLYDVTESELKIMRRGSDGGIFLNIAIGCFAFVSSSTISVVFYPPSSNVAQACLWCLIIFGFILSIIFFLLFKREESSVDEIYKTVLSRKNSNEQTPQPITRSIEKEK